VVARLFPFIWQPLGMSTEQFSLLLSANIGPGILVGEYLGEYLSDRFGRKKILIASAFVDAVFLWPLGFTKGFGWLLAWNFRYAIGMGFMLATNAVYLHEIAPPGQRHRIAMRTQLLSVVVIAVPSILAVLLDTRALPLVPVRPGGDPDRHPRAAACLPGDRVRRGSYTPPPTSSSTAGRRPPRHLPRPTGDRRAVHHHRQPRQLRVDPVVHAALLAGPFGHHRLARHAAGGHRA
jgi:hypothetical protein